MAFKAHQLPVHRAGRRNYHETAIQVHLVPVTSGETVCKEQGWEEAQNGKKKAPLGLVPASGLVCQGARVISGSPRSLRAAGGLTISLYSGVHRGFLSLSFCGCFQLLFQPADITVCLGLDDAQLRVDVFVLVAGVFLILAKE